ncbi:hypothetical protein Tco_0220384, partial [Tanacetum coccineum]
MSPWNGSISIHSSNYQMKLEKALDDFDSHQEKRLSSLRAQLGQQQDDIIRKINRLWKTISEKINDTSIPESVGNSMAFENIVSISHIESKDSEAEEGETTTDIMPEHGHNIAKEEVNEVIDEEESEVESDEDVKEILKEEEEDENFNSFPTMEELTHHEWLFKNPRPSWVKARIRSGSLN